MPGCQPCLRSADSALPARPSRLREPSGPIAQVSAESPGSSCHLCSRRIDRVALTDLGDDSAPGAPLSRLSPLPDTSIESQRIPGTSSASCASSAQASVLAPMGELLSNSSASSSPWVGHSFGPGSSERSLYVTRFAADEMRSTNGRNPHQFGLSDPSAFPTRSSARVVPPQLVKARHLPLLPSLSSQKMRTRHCSPCL